ncbi:hypothetical protein [Desulfosporosinus sp. FKB]|uniref:hypothetical protein n=1 Tax=Desulfosporosinus sp. FKB TaxID=1969835 RepID=UPI0014822F2D|nr:hypothetical protein [Desulfosporosinus sp. FKB]
MFVSNSVTFALTITSILTIAIYMCVGAHFTLQENRLKNLLSISLPAIIGLILWIICMINSPENTNFESTEGGIWIIFALYTYGTSYLTLSINEVLLGITNSLFHRDFLNTGYLLFAASFLPTLLFWLGMELKNSKMRLTQK